MRIAPIVTALALSALAPNTANAAALMGGFAYDTSYDSMGGFVRQYVLTTNNGMVSAVADAGAGAIVSSRAQSDAWINRVEVMGDSHSGSQFGSALSIFAVNQRVTGTPGDTARVSYTFGFDGSFAPGDPAHYPDAVPGSGVVPQNLTFYLIAYRGVAQGLSVVEDPYGTDLRFTASNGETSLSRAPGQAGYVYSLVPYIIEPGGFSTSCSMGDLRCTDGGVFNDTRTIAFDIGVDEDYYVVGYLTSQTNGTADFFHTAKLQSIGLAPQFGLMSDDGGKLVRSANGDFHLAVPEPSSWAMMLFGFAITGCALRKRVALIQT